MKKYFSPLVRSILIVAVLAVTVFQPQSSAYAAPILTITPITWNVVGLDSNNVNVGPQHFPVGARVCETGGNDATNVIVDFVWDDAANDYSGHPYINLRSYPLPAANSLSVFPATTILANTCKDFYFEITVTRNAAAYNTSRDYHITYAATGSLSDSTPTPREIYVEKLISQNRNAILDVQLKGVTVPTGFVSVPPGGSMFLILGHEYEIKLVAKTATNGYEQIESFINISNTIFQINGVVTTYTAPNPGPGTDPDAYTKLYADGCGWVNDPDDVTAPAYQNCEFTGKYGGNVTVTYKITVIDIIDPNQAVTALIYDFSESYHYNNDFDAEFRTITPVTVSYFSAQQSAAGVDLEWSTSSETANVGFNLYAVRDGVLTQVNDRLIPSQSTDSLSRLDYSFSADIAADTFFIEDVSINMDTSRHGPYTLGETYGDRLDADKIDHAAIEAEHAAKQAAYHNNLRSSLNLPAAALQPAIGTQSVAQLSTSLNLHVNKTGIHRVTYEALRDAGLNLIGVPISKLMLTNRGQNVRIYVSGAPTFGPGAFIEFYGQALDTLYTDTNIYTLQVSASAVAKIPVVSAVPGTGSPQASYAETVTVNNQNKYAVHAPGSDPWYDTDVLAYTSPKSLTIPFEVTNLVNTATPSQSLELVLWGVTDWPDDDPDHHILVSVNGINVADEFLNGLVERTIQVPLPAGTLHDGQNSVELTLPGDSGVDYEKVAVDKFSVTYQRAFSAVNGQLSFTSASKLLKVNNLPNRNVAVYRIEGSNIVRLSNVKIQQTGATFSVSFAGSGRTARYLVSTIAALGAPALVPARLTANLNVPAQYLIIAHPDFIAGIQPLVQARQAQGLTVSVVDVNDIYAKFSFGIFDPQAIKQYISFASHYLGTKYVLLVGGDTFNYRDYLPGVTSISFIPSLYVSTGEYANYVPADPFYADLNGDKVPDLAIGRFPARTSAELAMLVSKTLAYAAKTYAGTATFASDRYDTDAAVSFKAISDGMAASLPVGWSQTSIHLDDLTLATARAELLAAMNAGTALVTFTGHSYSQAWTFDPLFTIHDAAALTNYGLPFVAVQWGCWNTYYVDPVKTTLVQSLLFSGENGAAAVLGASTLTDSESEALLGQLLTPRLTAPGTLIGDALLQAKLELALTHPELLDVLLGWTLMGDPALVIQP